MFALAEGQKKKASRKLFYENEFCVNVNPSADRHQCGTERTTRKCRQLEPIRKNHATAIQTDAVLCVRVCLFSSGRAYTTKYVLGEKKNETLLFFPFFLQYRVIRHNFKAFFSIL